MGQAPPKAKPKNCWRVLCPGSSSEFLFNSPIHGSKGGKTFAGTSCAQAPFQNSFSRLLSKGAKKLLARPVPWRLYKIPFSSSFPKGQENCWRVLCPGSFSGFLFKAPVKLLARPFIPWLLFRIPFQSPKKIAGASFHSCPKIAVMSCALGPLQDSFSILPSMVPRGARHLLARPVPWLLCRIPLQGSFPRGPKNCWRVLCPGSFSRFLFQAPFQRGKNIAGASCALAPFQDSFSKPQENCWRVLSFLSKSWASLLALPHCRSLPYRSKRNISHGPPPGHHKQDFRN